MGYESAADAFAADTKPGARKIVSLYNDEASPAGEQRPGRVALVGTYSPRKCGIAMFTADLVEQLDRHHPAISAAVYALDAAGTAHDYAPLAGWIDCNQPDCYAAAARQINESAVDAVWLQHEFGIFGGPDGEMVCDFADRLAAPLIVTFETYLGGVGALT